MANIGAYRDLREECLIIRKNVEEKINILFPSEGIFPTILNNLFFDSLIFLDYDKVCISDEFAINPECLRLKKDISVLDFNMPIYQIRSIFTEDAKIAYTTHFDTFFTMLCSDKKTVEKIVTKYNFEGFYCDENTTVYWHDQNKI